MPHKGKRIGMKKKSKSKKGKKKIGYTKHYKSGDAGSEAGR